MIVVDTDVLAYAFIRRDRTRTALADEIDRRDADWRIPPIAVSEFRNVLASYVRLRGMPVSEAGKVLIAAHRQLAKPPVPVDGLEVLELAARSGCTAYDCEYVAAARSLGVNLVTGDRSLAQAFPETAILMADFAAYR